MSYEIAHDEPIAVAVARITREQARAAVAAVDDHGLDEHDVVAVVLARCREVRALFRLIRDAAPELYERENRWYRGVVAELAELRAAAAHVEAYDLLLDGYGPTIEAGDFAVIRETLEDRRDEIDDRRGIERHLAAARARLEEGVARVGGFTIEPDGPAAVVGGLGTTYARARDGLTEAYDQRTTTAFHEWRKRVEDHRHHVRLLRTAWPEVLELRGDELLDLTDIVGDAHELADLRHTLVSEPELFPDGDPLDAFLALLDRHRARLQREAEPLGTELFAEEPEAFVSQLRSHAGGWGTADPSDPVAAGSVTPRGD